MIRRLGKLARDRRGATAIEYGLIVCLIVVAIIVAIAAVGGSTGSIWGNMAGKVPTVEA